MIYDFMLRPLKNVSRYSGINHPNEIGTGIHTLSILRIALKLHFVQNVESDIPPLREAKEGVFQRSQETGSEDRGYPPFNLLETS